MVLPTKAKFKNVVGIWSDLNQYAPIVAIPSVRNDLPQVYSAIEKSRVSHLQRKKTFLQSLDLTLKVWSIKRTAVWGGCWLAVQMSRPSPSIRERVALRVSLADPVVYDLNAQACHVRGSKSRRLALITMFQVSHLKCTLNTTRKLQYISMIQMDL